MALLPVTAEASLFNVISNWLHLMTIDDRIIKKCSKVRRRNKDNVVRFIVNSSPLLIYELNILRVSSPRSKVQQRIITKKITKIGCGSVYNFKNFNRWQPLLVKRALVFGWKIPLLSRKWLIDDRSMIGRDFSINSMVWKWPRCWEILLTILPLYIVGNI